MSPAAALLALAVSSAKAAAVSPRTCDSAPQREIPDLTRRALESGQELVIHDEDMPSAVAGGMRAAKMLNFDGQHFFELLVVPSDDGKGLKPAAAILGMMSMSKTAKERRLFRMSMQGKLLEAVLVTDPLDEQGNSQGTHAEPLALSDPRAAMGFQRELRDLCRVAAVKKSKNEEISELREKVRREKEQEKP